MSKNKLPPPCSDSTRSPNSKHPVFIPAVDFFSHNGKDVRAEYFGHNDSKGYLRLQSVSFYCNGIVQETTRELIAALVELNRVVDDC